MEAGTQRIEVTASPSTEDCGVVMAGMTAFNKAAADLHSVPLAVLVYGETGVAVGGLLGRTSGGWLSVDVFWLPAELRLRGLGTQLLSAAEAEALQRGCVGVHLHTGSFQAPGFYERLGYKACGIIDDFPRGHRRITFSKRLDDKGATV